MESPNNPSQRKRVSLDEAALIEIDENIEKIKSISPAIWHKIEDWGRSSEQLTPQQIDTAFTLSGRVRNKTKISDFERNSGMAILDLVIEKSPEILFNSDDLQIPESIETNEKVVITIELIKEIVQWDKKHKKLKNFEYRFMADLADGIKPFSDRNKSIALLNYQKIKRLGFSR